MLVGSSNGCGQGRVSSIPYGTVRHVACVLVRPEGLHAQAAESVCGIYLPYAVRACSSRKGMCAAAWHACRGQLIP